MKYDTLSKALWNELVDKKNYSENSTYQQHLLEQYKLYVEMADRISARREASNRFFLILNSAIFVSAGLLINKGYNPSPKWSLLFPAAVLLLICFYWWKTISSYKQLNGAKYQIVAEFEQAMLARPYGNAEWNFLLKKGQNRKVYWPLTHLETKIPFLFAAAYIFTAVFLWFSK